MDTLKIFAVGDGAVGKTCMYVRYASGTYTSDSRPTVFQNYTVTTVFKNKRYNLSLWDTAGDEEYDRVRPLSYPNTNLFLVCFSVFSPHSLENVRDKWHPEISHHCPGTPFILVGTKRDLRTDPSVLESLIISGPPVSFEVASEVARELHASAYIEISSLNGDHIQDLFTLAIKAAATGSTGMPHSKRKQSVSSNETMKSVSFWGTLWNAVVPHIGTSRPSAAIRRPSLLFSNVFGILPHELWLNIFSFCDPKALFRLSAVCRDFRALASTNELWTRFIPTSIISSSSNKGVPLKSLFIASAAFYIYAISTHPTGDWIFVP
ncbi:cell division control protein 42-like [Pelomyxa schiedti]|nr:cell division control protein 42-like [Pelomyxa schiedti]